MSQVAPVISPIGLLGRSTSQSDYVRLPGIFPLLWNSMAILTLCLGVLAISCRSEEPGVLPQEAAPATVQEAVAEVPGGTPVEPTPQAVDLALATPATSSGQEPLPQPVSLQALTSRSRCPYLSNPVTWRYLEVLYDGGERVRDTRLAHTTTWFREQIEGLGTVFRVVEEIQHTGSHSPSRGEGAGQRYRSRWVLLTPEGLRISAPNAPYADFEEAVKDLQTRVPDWPLPGLAGCRWEEGRFQLPWGRTEGIRTHCPQLATEDGRACVTSVWVDRVGFVYREIAPLEPSGERMVLRDFLLEGDMVELAAPSSREPTATLVP
ncbi:MAG: hypothetical protein JW797_12015 [Bradymonadales bacterium]|nr:hypothetical protein [Bradymonadales bacterium]